MAEHGGLKRMLATEHTLNRGPQVPYYWVGGQQVSSPPGRQKRPARELDRQSGLPLKAGRAVGRPITADETAISRSFPCSGVSYCPISLRVSGGGGWPDREHWRCAAAGGRGVWVWRLPTGELSPGGARVPDGGRAEGGLRGDRCPYAGPRCGAKTSAPCKLTHPCKHLVGFCLAAEQCCLPMPHRTTPHTVRTACHA